MYKVLIVDDELIVRHAVQTLIRWETGKFVYAGSCPSGQAALEAIRQAGAAGPDRPEESGPLGNGTGIDIVITDIKMPDMDGIQLIKELKNEAFDGEVLVLSNYNDFELVREALKQGAFDYMLKLSLERDNFMKVLHEMADKLDHKERRYSSQGQTHSPGSSPGLQFAERFRLQAAEIWNGGSFLPPSSVVVEAGVTAGRVPVGGIPKGGVKEASTPEVRAQGAAEVGASGDLLSAPIPGCSPGEQVLLFLTLPSPASYLPTEENVRLETALVSLLGELSPGSRSKSAVALDSGGWLLALTCGPDYEAGLPGHLAERIASLMHMYYNLQTGIVYTEGACSVHELNRDIRRCRTAMPALLAASGSAPVVLKAPALSPSPATISYGAVNPGVGSGAAGEKSAQPQLQQEHMNGQQKQSEELFSRESSPGVGDLSQTDASPDSGSFSQDGSPFRSTSLPGIDLPEKTGSLKGDGLSSGSGSLSGLNNGLGFGTRSETGSSRLSSAGPSPRSSAVRPEIASVLDYLHQRFAERIILSEIAAYVNLSEAYLCQLFKTETGQSILSYLNEFRMTKAYELLSSGRFLVKEAAAEVGIHDPYYFNRLFKRQFGVSPKKIIPQPS